MASTKYLIVVLIHALCLARIEGGPIPSVDEFPGMARNMNEFLRCHGWQCDIWAEIKAKVKDIKMTWAEANNETEKMETLINEDPSELEVIDGDIWPTPELATDIFESIKGRQKRKLAKFNEHNKIWDSPVGYVIQSNLSRTVKNIVKRAIDHWAAQTCIEFKEYPESVMGDGIFSFFRSEDNLIYFQSGKVCSSYVGRIFWMQPIQLAERCGANFGAVVHEIGHALGFWHEHQRSDRDDYVTIYPENINENVDPWQIKHKGNTNNLVPYDYGSIMHYWAWAFTNSKGGITILPRDPRYAFTIGQKVGLSFLDSKLANMAYCEVQENGNCGLCQAPVGDRLCGRQGYQDPKDCSRCRCPDGFTGRYCEEVAGPKKATCGGEISLAPGDEHVIMSPNYESGGPYQDFTECTWLFKTPENYIPVFRMPPHDFGIYCNMPVCYHWLEIRFQNMSLTGPRYCCDDWSTSDVKINGVDQEMMILFRANTSSMASDRRGFKAKVYTLYVGNVQPPPGEPPFTSKTTTTHATSSTTSKTTTSPTTLSTTTNPTTTRTPKVDIEQPEDKKRCGPGHREKVVDLAFVLDSSGSVGRENWGIMKEFVIKILREYSLGPDCMQVGIITYSTDATLQLDFNESDMPKEELYAKIRAINWSDGWSNTADGIREMWTNLFTARRGERPKARNMCILLTDGVSNLEAWKTPSEAAKAKFGVANVHIVAIGITAKFQMKELIDIASEENLVFVAPEFTDLEKLVGSMLKEIDHFSEEVSRSGVHWSWNCDFEVTESGDNLCGMMQETRKKKDDFDWLVWSEATPSEETGPTRAASGYFYLYIEASSPRRPNDTAIIYMPPFRYPGEYCIEFQYIMYGYHINRLALFRKGEPDNDVLWYKDGNQSTTWIKQALTVTAIGNNDQFGFLGSRGGEFSGDIAIDDISVTSGDCGHEQ